MLTQQCLVSCGNEFFPMISPAVAVILAVFQGADQVGKLGDRHPRQNHLEAVFVYETSLYEVELS